MSGNGVRMVIGANRGIGLALTTIHVAGILHEERIEPEKSFSQCRPESLARLFQINSLGPLMVAGALISAQSRRRHFTFAALSAMVGSIGDNRLGGWCGWTVNVLEATGPGQSGQFVNWDGSPIPW